MEDELARCKDLAARARAMAKLALREADHFTLLSIAKDYERRAAEIEARSDSSDDQAT